MRIVFPYENILVLAGAVRALFSVADVVKGLGHEVTILADKPNGHKTHYKANQIRRYYPLKHLTSRDIVLLDFWGQREKTKAILEEADLVWAFSHFLARIDTHLPCNPNRLWAYIHYPEMSSGVSPRVEKLFVNGTYTLQAVRRRAWPQSSSAQILRPPIPTQKYKSLPFEEREIDIAVLSRVAPDKGFQFIKPLSDQGFKVVGFGGDFRFAYSTFNPQGDIRYNVTFKQLRDLLAQSKLYLHFRGLPEVGDPEHHGISVTEAMASGCVPIVHKSGGPYLDLLNQKQGIYGCYYESLDEVGKIAKRLLHNPKLWRRISVYARARIRELTNQSSNSLKSLFEDKK